MNHTYIEYIIFIILALIASFLILPIKTQTPPAVGWFVTYPLTAFITLIAIYIFARYSPSIAMLSGLIFVIVRNDYLLASKISPGNSN